MGTTIAHRRGDALALALFAVLRDRSEANRRFVLRHLRARLGGHMPWCEEAAVNALNVCANDLGRTPSRRDYDAWRAAEAPPNQWLSATKIRDTFGSWPKALDAATLEPTPDVRVRRLAAKGGAYSAEHLLYGLRQCAEAVGTPFTQQQYVEWAREQRNHPPFARYSADAWKFIQVFGSWRNALEAAGVCWSTPAPDAALPLVFEATRSCRYLSARAWNEFAREHERRGGDPLPRSQWLSKEWGASWPMVLYIAGAISHEEATRRERRSRWHRDG
jgi:hypothetical protein